MADEFNSNNYCIKNILGSSGGAASGFFILADPLQSSSLGKKYYEQAGEDWCPSSYEYWKDLYLKVLGDSGAWQRVRTRGKVALTCWQGSSQKEIVLYNFQSTTQAAQAYAAAGDPSCKDRNCPVDGIWGQSGVRCFDGGVGQTNAGFQTDQTSWGSEVYYYNTWPYALELSCWDTKRLIDQGKADYWNPLLLVYSPPTKAASQYEWVNLR